MPGWSVSSPYGIKWLRKCNICWSDTQHDLVWCSYVASRDTRLLSICWEYVEGDCTKSHFHMSDHWQWFHCFELSHRLYNLGFMHHSPTDAALSLTVSLDLSPAPALVKSHWFKLNRCASFTVQLHHYTHLDWPPVFARSYDFWLKCAKLIFTNHIYPQAERTRVRVFGWCCS